MSPPPGFTKLNRSNFEVWLVLIEALLTRKGLEEVAFGHVTKPLTGPNSKGVKDWERKNREARAEIILHVEEEQLAHCSGDTAFKIIEELTRVHRAYGLATRLAIRRRFLTMKKKPEQPMAQWVAEVRTLAQRLKTLDVSLDDEDIILALTMGLPRAYDMFVVSLDATPSDKLDLHSVIARLLNEESRHRDVAAIPTDDDETPEESAAAAVASKTAAPNRAKPASAPDANSKLARITCYACGEKGHYQANCPKSRAPRTGAHVAHVAEAHSASIPESRALTTTKIVEYPEGW